MARESFDHLARTLAQSPTRRAITRAVAGLVLGVSLVSATEESHAKKKKKCGPCRIRKKGRCRGNKPNGTTCNGDGQCFNGVCNTKPTCQGAGTDCTQGNPGVCCSGVCRAGDNKCQNGGNGNACLIDSDCITGLICVAYVCRSSCAGKANGTGCPGGGLCRDGACILPPTCLNVGSDCTQGSPGVCCSGVCLGNDKCQISTTGQPCLVNTDCLTGLTCEFFTCTGT